MQIFPGIHMFTLPLQTEMAPEGINVYLLEGPLGAILIDTGWDVPATRETLLNELAADGIPLRSIRYNILTHGHPDHIGLASLFQEKAGATLIMHRVDAYRAVRNPRDSTTWLRDTTDWLRIHGADPQELAVKPPRQIQDRFGSHSFGDVVEVEDGSTISNGRFSLEIIHTPGHSPGHICLFERSAGLLFSGDHVLPHITPFVGLGIDDHQNPLADFRRSLLKVRDLPARQVLPAHGQPFAGLRERADALMHHHDERTGEILETLECSPRSTYEIAGLVPWMKDIGARPFSQLPSMHKRLAVMETGAHLAWLEGENKAMKLSRPERMAWMLAGCQG